MTQHVGTLIPKKMFGFFASFFNKSKMNFFLSSSSFAVLLASKGKSLRSSQHSNNWLSSSQPTCNSSSTASSSKPPEEGMHRAESIVVSQEQNTSIQEALNCHHKNYKIDPLYLHHSSQSCIHLLSHKIRTNDVVHRQFSLLSIELLLSEGHSEYRRIRRVSWLHVELLITSLLQEVAFSLVLISECHQRVKCNFAKNQKQLTNAT